MRNNVLDALSEKESEVLYPPQAWGHWETDAVTIDKLTRSNKELEQFAFLAAHDIQEPLKVTYAYIQLLEKKYKGKLDDKADRIISAVLESTEKMQRLVQNLLKYSQVGKENIQLKELDSGVVIKSAIENLRVTIDESSTEIFYRDCPVVHADEIQLTQLFQNLINNAVKFRKNDEAARIHISARQENHQWVFSVQDNGIGIAPENTQNIFELFKRLHTQSEYTGSGIGLALCQRIVESHQGRIWAESQPGEGTTMCFTIPQKVL